MYARRLLAAAFAAAITLLQFCPAGAAPKHPVPENATAVLTVSSVERMHEIFELEALRGEFPARFDSLAGESLARVGFDLLDLRAMRDAGFRTGDPVYVASFGEPECFAVYLPGSMKALQAMVDARSGADAMEAMEHEGLTMYANASLQEVAFHRGKYVVVVGVESEREEGVVDAARFLHDTNLPPVTKSDSYRRLAKRVSRDADFHVFMGAEMYSEDVLANTPGKMAEHGLSDDEAAQARAMLGLEDAAAVFTADIGADHIDIDGYSWLGNDPEVLTWYDIKTNPAPFLERLASKPWLAGVHRFNTAAAWKSLKPLFEQFRPDSLPSVDEELAKFAKETGIDLEAEVLGQINGNLGLVIDQVSFMSLDLTLFAQVVDPALARETLLKHTKLARKKLADGAASGNPESQMPPLQIEERGEGDDTFYQITTPYAQICYGVTGDHVVFTTSGQRYHEIASGDASVSRMVDHPIFNDAVRDPRASAFYLNFAGLNRDLQQLLPMFAPDKSSEFDLLAALKDMASSTVIEDNGFRQSLSLRCNRAGVWKDCAEKFLRPEPATESN